MRWFRPIGVFYAPVSVAGWLISAALLAFCAQVFLVIDARSHSVSDTFYGVFPYWAPALLLWLWIAGRTSQTET
jgi:hypothetical protein